MQTTNTTGRLSRTYCQTLRGTRERVFPLLCPEREKEWLPGWDAQMLYSDSGVAEPGAVFRTQADGVEVIWLVAEHRAPDRVHLVRWHRDAMVVDMELDLSSRQPGMTTLDIRYTYTATSPVGRAQIEAMSPDQWQAQMQRWQNCLNEWLAQHPL